MKRDTKQRQQLRRALERTAGFISAQELHQSLREEGSSIGLATVYRTLGALVDDGSVDYLALDGEKLYRVCSPGHHHHLICRECGHTTEIEAGAVETWAREVAAEHGYVQPRHVVDIFGTCPDCQRGLPGAD